MLGAFLSAAGRGFIMRHHSLVKQAIIDAECCCAGQDGVSDFDAPAFARER